MDGNKPPNVVAESLGARSLGTRRFYDELAEDYHLLLPSEWWPFSQWQGKILDKVLAEAKVLPGDCVLDCTCGIGTQALPLASLGYRVVGADLSARAIERAKAEASLRSIDAEFISADVRSLAERLNRQFSAVISFDNSLPHLLTDEDLVSALRSVRAVMLSGGLFVASIRDYDQLVRDRQQGVVPTVKKVDGVPAIIIGQAWEWSADFCEMVINQFILKKSAEGPDGWGSTVYSTRYRALQRAEMDSALTAASFVNPRWIFPAESGYYQPIVLALAG